MFTRLPGSDKIKKSSVQGKIRDVSKQLIIYEKKFGGATVKFSAANNVHCTLSA